MLEVSDSLSLRYPERENQGEGVRSQLFLLFFLFSNFSSELAGEPYPDVGVGVSMGGGIAIGGGGLDIGFDAGFGGSGIGHICIVIAQSGLTIASYTCGRTISPPGATRS